MPSIDKLLKANRVWVVVTTMRACCVILTGSESLLISTKLQLIFKNCKEILTMLQSDDYGMITRGVKAAPPLRPVAAGVARGVEHGSEDCQPWWPERLRRRKKRQASPANITREVEPIIIAQSTAFNGTTLKKP